MDNLGPAAFENKELMKDLQSFICTTPDADNSFCHSEEISNVDKFCDYYINWLDDVRLGQAPSVPSTSFLTNNSQSLDDLANYCVDLQKDSVNVRPSNSNQSLATNDSASASNNTIMAALAIGDLALFLLSWFSISAIETLQKDPISLIKTFGRFDNFMRLFEAPKEPAVSQETIIDQLSKWARHKIHAPSGISLNSLPYQVRNYVAQLVLKKWNALWRVTKNAHLILQDGSHLMDHPQGLPGSFISDFAKTYLIEQNVQKLERKTRKWLASSLDAITFNYDSVIIQIHTDIQKRYKINLPPGDLVSLTNVILQEWSNLRSREKIGFIDLNSPVSKQELPSAFVIKMVDKNYDPNDPKNGSGSSGLPPPSAITPPSGGSPLGHSSHAIQGLNQLFWPSMNHYRLTGLPISCRLPNVSNSTTLLDLTMAIR